MLFILRMLHAQLQRQVHLPEAERPRVPLLVDEAHYVAGGENVVDQIATHRAAGLEARVRAAVLRAARLRLRAPAEDPQGRAQPAAEPLPVPDGRRPGRRAGHPDRDGRLLDDDPRRPRLPRPPARHPRAGAQLPQLLLPRLMDRQRHPGAELHGADLPAARRRRGVGRAAPRRPGRARRPVPRAARSTLATDTAPANGEPARRRTTRRRDSAPPAGDAASRRRPGRTRPRSPTSPRSAAQARGAGRLRASHRRRPPTSPTARCAGSSAAGYTGPPTPEADRPVADTLRELAFLDRINEIGPADQLDGASRLPRLYDEDYTILALLDRVGFAPATLIAPRRATRPRAPHRLRPPRQALPPRADRAAHHRPARALIQRRQTAAAALADPPRPPGRAAARARPGDLPQARMEAHRATPRRPARARPPRARLGDRVPPHRRRARHRPLAHAPLRHRPLPRPPSRPRTAPPPDHAQRDPGPRRTGDHRPRAQDVHRDQARPLARTPHRTAEAHLRPARRDRPHRPPLLQPREVPRLRRIPLRLEPRPPPLPSPGHPSRRRVRQPEQPRRARLRARGRRADDRPDRGHGQPQPSTGTTPAATTCSSPSRPTSTTAICRRSRCRRSRPGCANGSPEAASSRSTGSACSAPRARQPDPTTRRAAARRRAALAAVAWQSLELATGDLCSGRKRSSGARGPGHPLLWIGVAPSIAKPASPFAAKHSPAAAGAVQDPMTKALVAVCHAVDECDRERARVGCGPPRTAA